jgi:hypothetical protein
MRKITLRNLDEKNSPKVILMTVMGNSPVKAITVDEMRKRVKVIDALEKMDDKGVILLEDAEYQVLLEAVNSFPWSQASYTLLGLIDDVVNAEKESLLKVIRDES